MKDDLEVIFGHCAGFDGVDTAEKFHGYIRKCQVETTMPFNDYWPDKLPIGNAKLPITPLKWIAILAACALAARGHATAALPSAVINSRRPMLIVIDPAHWGHNAGRTRSTRCAILVTMLILAICERHARGRHLSGK